MATSQYCWPFDRWKPMSLSLGAIALTRNYTQKAMTIE